MDSAGEESACFSRSGKKFIASSVSNPEIIGYYSTDGEKCYLADSSKMSYFKPPRSTQIRMDLNQSIESAVRFPQASAGDGSLSHFLEWVVRNHTEIRGLASDRWIEPDFVAAGGVLTRLLYTRYKPKSEWEIRAAKWKGTIYLCPVVTNSEENVHQVQASKFHAWAYKFKQHIVSDDPDTEPDTSRPVVELPEFRCVFKRRFAHHSVLFTSNVHAVQSVRVLEDPLPLKDLRLVEVKLKKILQHTGQWRLFTEDVLLRWWAQSFPAGTDQTLCGWRDNEGIVRGWTTYSLDQMIELGQGAWDPQACIKWCNDFLNECAKLVVDDCDKAVYKFEKLPNGHLRTTRVPASYSFIPTAVLAKMGASDAA